MFPSCTISRSIIELTIEVHYHLTCAVQVVKKLYENQFRLCLQWIIEYTKCWDLPVSDIFQIIGDIIDHLFGKVFEFTSVHVDLKYNFKLWLDFLHLSVSLRIHSELVVNEKKKKSHRKNFPRHKIARNENRNENFFTTFHNLLIPAACLTFLWHELRID